MERQQQIEDQQRALAPDGWVTTMENSQLGDEFDPQAFSIVGSLLNSQSLGQEPGSSADNFSQTPAVTTASASTLTAPAPPPPAIRNRRVLFGLLAACVALLLGTGTFCLRLHGQNRAWKAENAALRAKITKLETTRTSAGGSPGVDAFATAPPCPGSQLIDTCWFKVGWGDCTKDVLEDPVKPLEDALRLAWDSTAEVVGAVADTVASDLRHVCDAVHSFGRFVFEL